MGRGFLKKIVSGEQQPKPVETEAYIDLGAMKFEDEIPAGATTTVKVAELHRHEDLPDLMNLVYNGHIVVIDISTLGADELALRRVTNEIKNVTRDTGGDAAGISKNMIMVTPRGITIDRKVIRGGI
ncbi:MAG: cell division protein SepF [Thermoplasmata archaeon]